MLQKGVGCRTRSSSGLGAGAGVSSGPASMGGPFALWDWKGGRKPAGSPDWGAVDSHHHQFRQGPFGQPPLRKPPQAPFGQPPLPKAPRGVLRKRPSGVLRKPPSGVLRKPPSGLLPKPPKGVLRNAPLRNSFAPASSA